MIYLHVTIQLQRGKMNEFCSIFEKEIVPIWNKHGQKLAAAWKTTVGAYDEVTDLWAFDSLAEMERIRSAISQDPKAMEAAMKTTPLVIKEVSKIMLPLPYSPMN